MPEPAEHWSASALCAQTDPALFFPTKDDGSGAARAAKRICARCPVRVECAAAVTPADRGIWSGQSERQRRKRGKSKPRARSA